MAITTTKVTYSLNPQTVEHVQELATAWGVPKSEVVRRVVDDAVIEKLYGRKETPLEAFRRLRKSGRGLSVAAAKKFNAEVRAARRASGRKRG
jgi:hypothetical protein